MKASLYLLDIVFLKFEVMMTVECRFYRPRVISKMAAKLAAILFLEKYLKERHLLSFDVPFLAP